MGLLCVFHAYLLLSRGIGPTRPSVRNSLLMKIVSRDLWRSGYPPLSARVSSCDRAAWWRSRSRDRADGVLSLLRVPPPPDLPVYVGEGSPRAPPYIKARAPSLWRRIRYKGPLSTHTQKLHTQGLGRLCGIGRTCPLQSSLLAVF
jgi:hypothetical protein